MTPLDGLFIGFVVGVLFGALLAICVLWAAMGGK